MQRYNNFKQTSLYRILDKQGIYTVVISNDKIEPVKQRFTLNYTLFVNNKDMILLLPDIPIMNSELLGKTDKYELLIESPSQVFIEVFTCGGHVTL